MGKLLRTIARCASCGEAATFDGALPPEDDKGTRAKEQRRRKVCECGGALVTEKSELVEVDEDE